MASLRKEQNPCKSTQYLNFVSVPSVDVLNLNIANRGLKSVKDQGNRKKRWKFFEWKTFDIRRKKYVRLKLFNFLIKLKKNNLRKRDQCVNFLFRWEILKLNLVSKIETVRVFFCVIPLN